MSIGYIPFELNYGYHPRVFYEKNIDPYSKSKSADKLWSELTQLMIVYQENFYYPGELWKKSYNHM